MGSHWDGLMSRMVMYVLWIDGGSPQKSRHLYRREEFSIIKLSILLLKTCMQEDGKSFTIGWYALLVQADRPMLLRATNLFYNRRTRANQFSGRKYGNPT